MKVRSQRRCNPHPLFSVGAGRWYVTCGACRLSKGLDHGSGCPCGLGDGCMWAMLMLLASCCGKINKYACGAGVSSDCFLAGAAGACSGGELDTGMGGSAKFETKAKVWPSGQ